MNAVWFSVRARALGSFLSGIIAVVCGNLLGTYLDRTSIALRTRARSSFFVIAILQGAWWLWITVLVTQFRNSRPTYDWTSEGFGRAFAVFIFLTVGFQLNYLFLYFVIGNLAEDEEQVIRYAALLRGTESAWQAVSYGITSVKLFAEEPENELAELTAIYEGKGLQPATARRVAEELTAHDAFAAHVEAELGLDPDELIRPKQATAASAAAFTVGGLLPLAAILLGDLLKLNGIVRRRLRCVKALRSEQGSTGLFWARLPDKIRDVRLQQERHGRCLRYGCLFDRRHLGCILRGQFTIPERKSVIQLPELSF